MMAPRLIAFIALTLTTGISPGSTGALARDRAGVAIVRVSPRVAFAPARVTALVQVEPHDENRRLQLVLESAEHYHSTDVELEGAEARKSHFLTWRDLPPGSYVLTATVHRSNGQTLESKERLQIYG
jgi:hypothetical protein